MCGYESKEGPLPVHFCFGSVGKSDPCTDAMDTREKWHERVLDIFNEAGEDADVWVLGGQGETTPYRQSQ